MRANWLSRPVVFLPHFALYVIYCMKTPTIFEFLLRMCMYHFAKHSILNKV